MVKNKVFIHTTDNILNFEFLNERDPQVLYNLILQNINQSNRTLDEKIRDEIKDEIMNEKDTT